MEEEESDILGCAETWLRKEDLFNEIVMGRKDDTEIQEKDSLNRNCRGKRGIIVLKNNKNKNNISWCNISVEIKDLIHIVIEEINLVFIYIPPNEYKNQFKKNNSVYKENKGGQ
jgi:hypothetical protein